MFGQARAGLFRYRYWALTVWAVPLMLLARSQGGDGGDWPYFLQGFSLLVHGHVNVVHRYETVHLGGGGLSLYANRPDIQIGPLALLVAGGAAALDRVNRYLSPAITVLIGVVSLRGVESLAVRSAPTHRRIVQEVTFVAGIFILYAWVQAFVYWRHLDDMLVLVGVVVALLAVQRRQPWLLGLAIGLSIAAKPTALVLLPLLLALTWRANTKAILLAGALACACWFPFIIAAPATLHAGVPIDVVKPGSGLTALGFAVGSRAPAAIRAVQLTLALVGGGVAIVRGRWYLVPLIGFGLRTALDPSVASYYAVSVMLGALVADLLHRQRFPIAVLLTWLTFSEPLPMSTQYFSPAAPDIVQGWLRLTIPVLLTIVVLARHERAPGAQLPVWVPRVSALGHTTPANSERSGASGERDAPAEQEPQPLAQLR